MTDGDGAGALGDVGHQGGRNYSVNVPLQEGMDDESYKFVFEPIMQKVSREPHLAWLQKRYLRNAHWLLRLLRSIRIEFRFLLAPADTAQALVRSFQSSKTAATFLPPHDLGFKVY